MRFLPFVLALLAVFAVANAILAFRQAPTIWHINRSFAFACLAATWIVASIRSRINNASRHASAEVTVKSSIIAIAIFAASMVAIWAGCGSLFEIFELCNQEYLHWLPANQPKQFPIAIHWAIAAMTFVCIVFLAIGLFLFWYQFLRRKVAVAANLHIRKVSQMQDLSSDSNPYRAPQQRS